FIIGIDQNSVIFGGIALLLFAFIVFLLWIRRRKQYKPSQPQ
ncbi:MAG: LPXTG cell wall anchor domain-containing protein, partial [Methanobacteriota archaeon]